MDEWVRLTTRSRDPLQVAAYYRKGEGHWPHHLSWGWAFEAPLPDSKEEHTLSTPELSAVPLVARMIEVVRAYEAWEADLVLNADWSGSMPTLTLDQCRRLVEIHGMRDAALAALEA